jgi:hypothetical protein
MGGVFKNCLTTLQDVASAIFHALDLTSSDVVIEPLDLIINAFPLVIDLRP